MKKKLVNQVINEIFRQLTLTLTLELDVSVRPMKAKGLIFIIFLRRVKPNTCKTRTHCIQIQGLLVICVFGLCGFGYTRLRKTINIKKKIVQFTTRDRLYVIFGCAQTEVDVELMNCSLFYAILCLRGAFGNVTPRINGKALHAYQGCGVGRHKV